MGPFESKRAERPSRCLTTPIAVTAASVVLLMHSQGSSGQVCANWVDVSQPGPQMRIEHAMAFDSERGVTVLFSGWDSPDYFPETWEWDGTQWTLAATDGPSPRKGHAMAYDRQRHVVVLFGGEQLDPFGDTWEWDGQSWSHVSDQGPSARSWHSMAYDSARGRTVLFGGRSDAGYESDTWEWDGSQWALVATSGPLRRYNHSMAYDRGRGVVVLFGGRPSAFGDTWEWDGATWTRVATTGPRARFQHSLVYDDARRGVVLFGGYDDDRNYYGDTWQWDGLQWTRLDMALPPVPRLYHAMAFDSWRKATVLFGGSDGRSLRDDTWELQTPWWFDQHPESATIPEGQPARFHVETAGATELAYRWRRNGAELVDGGSISGTATHTLMISNARLADAGQYDCLVSDGSCERSSDPAQLRVTAPHIGAMADCPNGGPLSVSWDGATADGQIVLIFAFDTGRARIPSRQPCAGTRLRLSLQQLQIAWVGEAGPEGAGVFEGQAPARACGGYLQLLDLQTCSASNVVQLE